MAVVRFVWKVLFFYFLLLFVKCDQNQYNINLNDFVTANLAYFQSAFPLNVDFDGKLLFGEVDAPTASFYDVNLEKIEDFERDGDFVQLIDLDAMVNNVSGRICAPRLTLHVGRIVAPSYFGYLSPIDNVSIELSSPELDISVVMSPTPNSQSCSLTATITVSIDEAILYSVVPFANERNVTAFIDSTIVNYFNTQLSSMTVAITQANCNPFSAYLTLVEGLKNVSRQTVKDFIQSRQAHKI